jgi:hypothetical protein
VDLYRYFHPHHNPRLSNVPMRLQELSELEQAAIELQKAVKRAEIRTSHVSFGPIAEDHFSEISSALDYVILSLSLMRKAHPGDGLRTLAQMLSERKRSPGWENWSKLLEQRLRMASQV